MDQKESMSLDQFTSGHRQMFKTTRILSSSLPDGTIDILIIDKLGSAANEIMDVITRMRGYAENPDIRRVYVRDLSNGANGNGAGIGYADFVSAMVVQKTDRLKTYTTSIAASNPRTGATPIYYETDAEALEACLNTIEDIPVGDIKLVYIKDAIFSEVIVSPLVLTNCQDSQVSQPVDSLEYIEFDQTGNIVSPFQYSKDEHSIMTSVTSFLKGFFCMGY